MNPSVYQGERIGDPQYQGFMLYDVVEFPSGGNFLKSEFPGIRAIRIDGGLIILEKDLGASESISAGQQVEVYC